METASIEAKKFSSPDKNAKKIASPGRTLENGKAPENKGLQAASAYPPDTGSEKMERRTKGTGEAGSSLRPDPRATSMIAPT